MGSRKHQSRQSRRQFSASGRPSKQFSGARSTNGTRFTAPTPSGMGGRTSCPQGMHMMGDGSCMPGEYHGAPSSMGRRGRISGGTGQIMNPTPGCIGSCFYWNSTISDGTTMECNEGGGPGACTCPAGPSGYVNTGDNCMYSGAGGRKAGSSPRLGAGY